VGTEVGYAAEHARFLLNDADLYKKGYDVDEADADAEVSQGMPGAKSALMLECHGDLPGTRGWYPK
jgi:hypothetical protein